MRHHMRPRYMTRTEAVQLLRDELHKYESVAAMARAWGVRANVMGRILHEGRIEGHAARVMGLRPVRLYQRRDPWDDTANTETHGGQGHE